MSISSNGKFYKFISGKGFYVALAICLVGTGAAAWVGVNQAIQSIDDQQSQTEQQLSSEQSQVENPLAQTNDQVSGIEKPSYPTTPKTSSSASSSSSKVEETTSEPSANAATTTSDVPVQQETNLLYALPVEGEIFNGYSGDKLVKNVTLNDWRTHNGIDIKAERGTKIVAVADGTVTRVAKDPMWGTVVEITHSNSTVSTYCGLDETVQVEEGQNVKLGEILGTLGTISCESASEPHLHFEMKKDGQLGDPLEIMNKRK